MNINRRGAVWRVQWTDWSGERQTRDVFSEKAAQAVARENRPNERPPNWRPPATNLTSVPTLTDEQLKQLEECGRRQQEPTPALDLAIQERIAAACAEIKRQQIDRRQPEAA